MVIIPKAKIPEPIMGIIQCSLACADQPYQLHRLMKSGIVTLDVQWQTYKIPTGTKKEPKKSAGIRISGLAIPPFLFASCPTNGCKNSKEKEDTLTTYMLIDLISAFSADYRGSSKTNAKSKVCQTANTSLKAVGSGEEFCLYVRNTIQNQVQKQTYAQTWQTWGRKCHIYWEGNGKLDLWESPTKDSQSGVQAKDESDGTVHQNLGGASEVDPENVEFTSVLLKEMGMRLLCGLEITRLRGAAHTNNRCISFA